MFLFLCFHVWPYNKHLINRARSVCREPQSPSPEPVLSFGHMVLKRGARHWSLQIKQSGSEDGNGSNPWTDNAIFTS